MNKIETIIKKSLTKKGYKVLKNGWPDLLVADGEGNPFFIEVKAGTDRLRGPQKAMLQMLTDLGLQVFIVAETNNLYQQDKDFPDLKLYNSKIDINRIETISEYLLRIKKEIIIDTLKKYNNDQIKTADHLGITHRQLRYAISKF